MGILEMRYKNRPESCPSNRENGDRWLEVRVSYFLTNPHTGTYLYIEYYRPPHARWKLWKNQVILHNIQAHMCKLNLYITLPQANMAMEHATFKDISKKNHPFKGDVPGPCWILFEYCRENISGMWTLKPPSWPSLDISQLVDHTWVPQTQPPLAATKKRWFKSSGYVLGSRLTRCFFPHWNPQKSSPLFLQRTSLSWVLFHVASCRLILFHS